MATKKNKMTEDELLGLAVEILGDVWDYKLDKKDEADLFKKISTISGSADYFRTTLAEDVKRYFNATSEKERDTIRGAMSRTMYWRGLIREAGAGKKKDTKPLKLARYA